MSLGDLSNKNKRLGSINVTGDDDTDEYVQRAYDLYSRPYRQEFERLGESTRKEALAKGLYLSGDYGKAIGDNLEEYNRRIAEQVVIPLAKEGMDRGFKAQELGLRERQQDEVERAALIQEGFTGREIDIREAQQAETERAAQVDESFRRADLTGMYGGGIINADALGLDAKELQRFVGRDSSGFATDEEKAAQNFEIRQAFINAVGREPTAEEVSSVLRGGNVAVAGVQTLAGRQQLVQEQDLQQRRDQLEEDKRQFDAELAQDKTLSDADRLERQRQFDAELLRREIEFAAEAVGMYGSVSVSADTFGIDISDYYDAETGAIIYENDEGTGFFDYADRLQDELERQGLKATDDEIARMLRGESVQLTGVQTLASRMASMSREEFDAELSLRKDQLEADKEQFTARLAQDLSLSDADREERARQFNMDMIRREAEFAAQQTGRYGVASVSAESFGIDISEYLDPETGQLREGGFDIFMDYVSSMETQLAAAGISMSDAEIQSFLMGETISVTGSLTLEGRRQLFEEEQQAIINQQEEDRITIQEDRVKLDEAIARAQQAGTYIDPRGGKPLDTLEKERLALQEIEMYLELTGSANGEDENGNFLGTLAYNAQKKQLVWEEERRNLENAIQRANATGNFIDPETNQSIDTLQKKLQDADIRIENAKLAFTKEKESYDRQERYAELTGTFPPVNMGASEFGIDMNLLYPDGGDEPDIAYFMGMADVLQSNANRLMGRDLTDTEINALLLGRKITTADATTTLASQIQIAQLTGKYKGADIYAKVIEEAKLTGFLDETPTLQQNEAEFREAIENRVQALNEQRQAFTENMELMRETGYMEIGTNGTVTAEDIGIDVTYAPTGSPAEMLNSLEAEKLQDTAQILMGRELTDPEIIDLLQGNGISIESPIRVETLAARSERNRNQLEVAQLMGTLGEKKTEAARQFDATLAEQQGLNQADIARINADVVRADRQLEGQLAQWAAQTNLDIATLTGEFGVSGDITAEELGVVVDLSQFEGSIGDQLFAAIDEYGPVLTEAFTSMTGRAPTDQELRNFLQGGSVSVEATPTLASKQLSQLVSSQSMERANDMYKFSQQYGLEVQEFAEMQQQFDDTNARLTDEISKRFTLDKMNFTLARQEMEANLTGRYNVSGTIDATSLGFDTGRYEGLTYQSEELQNAGKQLSEVYETLTGNTIGLHDAMKMLQGRHSVQADTTWTQQAREAAMKYNLDQDKFEEAMDQFNRTFEDEQRRAYIQMKGTGTDYEGNEIVTQGYRAYQDARNDFEKVEARRDLVWSGFLTDAQSRDFDGVAGEFDAEMADVNFSTSFRAENGREPTMEERAEAVEQEFSSIYGYVPRRNDVIAAITGDIEYQFLSKENNRFLQDLGRRYGGRTAGFIPVFSFETGNNFEEEAGRLANMLNGHSMQVVEAMSGWQQAGMFIGNAAVNLASAKLAGT
mgnify:CR=1 FL=1|tara:strand:+ start:2704 stop:7053 length:4350 start_codon:yes stop_codon:yes gene_type:complete